VSVRLGLAEHPNVMGKVLVSSYLGERGAWLVIEVAQADVPTSDAMFPRSCGLGRDQRQLSCLPSADHVLNQPSLSRQTWQEVVNKMITAYKALIARRREPSTTASARLIFN